MLSSAATTLLTRTAAPSVLRRTAAPAVGAVRNLNLHEYQSAKIMSEMGVNVPFGIPAHTVQQAVDAAEKIGDEEVVIKSQILAGGRGLGKFKDNDDGTPGLQVRFCSANVGVMFVAFFDFSWNRKNGSDPLPSSASSCASHIICAPLA